MTDAPETRLHLQVSREQQSCYRHTLRRSSIVSHSSQDNKIVRIKSIFFAISSSLSIGSLGFEFCLLRELLLLFCELLAFCLFDDFVYYKYLKIHICFFNITLLLQMMMVVVDVSMYQFDRHL
jgi:hypothetical protein